MAQHMHTQSKRHTQASAWFFLSLMCHSNGFRFVVGSEDMRIIGYGSTDPATYAAQYDIRYEIGSRDPPLD